MKKKVWIINHYAGNTFFSEGGRHFWLAKELKSKGYEPTVFCCNVKHGSEENYWNQDILWHKHKTKQGIPFIFIKSTFYSGNGMKRIRNMVVFARNFCRTAKQYEKKYGRPDVIIASSVHPLTVLAGERIANKFGVPCVCEIRDLWPESIFAYYPEKKSKFLAKILYCGEKYMYKEADAVVMTWPGGKEYIKQQGWDKDIPSNKVFYISNGVDLEGFNENQSLYLYEDKDLKDTNYFKAVYTGSIRKVNNLGMLVSAAEILNRRGNTKVKLLVWGDGDELELLQNEVKHKNLDNIIFKGVVSKQYIPSILKQCDCTVMHNTSTVLDRYGQSQNKFFEYLAAGKPVLMTYSVGYSVCEKNNCGIEVMKQSPESIADALEKVSSLSKTEYCQMCSNAEETARIYDFKTLTKKLIDIIESL